MPSNFFSAIRARMPEPEHLFLELAEWGDRTGETIAYGEIGELTGQIANRLVALGVKPGDRVVVQTEKSPETLLVYLACLRAGFIFLPLNTAYTPGEIEYFYNDAEPALFICNPEDETDIRKIVKAGMIATLDQHRGGSLLKDIEAESATFDDQEVEPDDIAAILYTSGTTGRSKGAMLSHSNLESNATVLVDYWQFMPNDVLLHALPVFHAHGLFTATNTILMCGGSMLYLPKFDAGGVMKHLPRATSMMGVPTFYTRLLAHAGLNKDATDHMRVFISGSAPLLAETHGEFEARTGHAILERYGMSETNMNCSNPYEGQRIAGTVGFPLPGVEVRIVNPDTAEELGTDEIGLLEVRGPHVFKGYWRNPEKTAEDMRTDGFFITGDLAKIDADGYVHIVGRGKDLVISGGYNVYPKEVEAEIDALDGVIESAVFGVPHPEYGEGVTAAVVLADGAELSADQIERALEDRLARFKQPKKIFFIPELPRNTMGKVQKNALRDEYSDIYAGN